MLRAGRAAPRGGRPHGDCGRLAGARRQSPPDRGGDARCLYRSCLRDHIVTAGAGSPRGSQPRRHYHHPGRRAHARTPSLVGLSDGHDAGERTE
uniref:Uncharacterized protein n=1 Tax=uncultured alpha proteobacterium HF0130_06E21 TaxID=710808 RepID=E0XT34_9PROT|nr:hypothetical protein [uncultured alpha proteobacterium HF0130_06E21]